VNKAIVDSTLSPRYAIQRPLTHYTLTEYIVTCVI